MLKSKKAWDMFARRCAKRAHEDMFSVRHGAWYAEMEEVVVLFDNNPFVAHSPRRRDEELNEFRRWLVKHGYQELGYGTYPNDGYTYALVVDATETSIQSMLEAMWEIRLEALRRILRDQAPATT